MIGIAGSVAVGKSTTARLLRELLAGWPEHPRVSLVTTDGFLLPNAELERRGLMQRKGFPESYDRRALLRFVMEVKSGADEVSAPVYDHLGYDIVPGAEVIVQRPDILIVEGLNVLQPARVRSDGTTGLAVSDFFDFSVYVDADADVSATGTSTGSSRCGTPRSATRAPTSPATPMLTTEEAVRQARRLWDTHQRAQPDPEHPARPGAGPPRSCARTPTTWSSGSASARSDAARCISNGLIWLLACVPLSGVAPSSVDAGRLRAGRRAVLRNVPPVSRAHGGGRVGRPIGPSALADDEPVPGLGLDAARRRPTRRRSGSPPAAHSSWGSSARSGSSCST